MPRFRDEEHKQEWLAKCAATRARNQKAKAKSPKLSMGFQDETTEARPINGGATKANLRHNGITGALEEIDSKIAALQQVRRHLVHAHELVQS